jgi:hypothetical protein
MKTCWFLKRILITGISLFLFFSGSNFSYARDLYSENLLSEPNPSWPPRGQKIKCPVTRDTSLSSVGQESSGSNGRGERLKVKGQQEYILFDIDPALLKGKLISGALLRICSASPKDAPLARLGVSTLASEWTEGTSAGYRPQAGSSCYDQAAYQKQDWTYPGSTLMDAVFGRGHTLWKFADCRPPDLDGWQICAIEPDVIAARAAGLSYGFCAYDEVGSVWSLKNGKFNFTHFPNRFCYSKESRNTPYVEVWYQGEDSVPPEPIRDIRSEIERFPAGQALIFWNTPKDSGGGKTLGFQVSYKKGNTEQSVPRYLIPMAGNAGEEVRMHLQDLPFKPGEKISLTVRPVDSAGNIGKGFTKTINLSPGGDPTSPDISQYKPFPPNKQLPTAGNIKVAVVDLLDKINPKTGEMVPKQEDGYKGGNHLFSAKQKQIRLYGARNETVAFQVCLEGNAENVSLDYRFDEHPELKPKIWEFAYVSVMNKAGKVLAELPDPLIETKKDTKDTKNFQSFICELYIPHETEPGKKKGTLMISADGKRLELDTALQVWNFTLPDKLSFVPEMNAYGTVSPYHGYEYYRLAHEHRTCINRLPYGWNGKPSYAPEWKGNNFDWARWDEKAGPLLDGTAFADLPRKGEPLDVFYLPFSENWPASIGDHYTPSYWADEAFTETYKDEMKKAFAAFAKHCDEKGWHDTRFQFYLNNKVTYRRGFPQSSAPWFFDEPVNTQDFWALRWYGILWHMATDPVKGNAKMDYRGDISYSQFGRNMLWGIIDTEYIGGNTAQKTRMKHDEQILWGNGAVAEYGTASKVEESNTQPVLWCLSAWANGATGVLPWQTIGSKNCWKKAEQTALFYPHPEGPKPSVRLKAFTRGQQDTEYLTLLCDVYGIPRFAATEWIEKIAGAQGKIRKAFAGDAGTVTYDRGTPAELWQLRTAVGKMLSDKAPAYRREIKQEISLNVTGRLPDIGYVTVSPKIEPCKPEGEGFKSIP